LLYDSVFALALPYAAGFANHKNVFLLDGELEAVSHYALKDASRKTLKKLLKADDDARFAISQLINHALDVLAMKRVVMILEHLCEEPPLAGDALTSKAEEYLKQKKVFANEERPVCTIWKEPIEQVADYIRHAVADPIVTLPTSATVRLPVRASGPARPSMEVADG
jgi:hypothetical protein